MDAMPMGYQQTGVFLHQKAVQGLQLQLASEQVIGALKIKDYTLRDMAKDLNATYRKYMAVSRGTEISFRDLVRSQSGIPIMSTWPPSKASAAHAILEHFLPKLAEMPWSCSVARLSSEKGCQ